MLYIFHQDSSLRRKGLKPFLKINPPILVPTYLRNPTAEQPSVSERERERERATERESRFSRQVDDRQTNDTQIVCELSYMPYGELLQYRKCSNASSDPSSGVSQLSLKA